MNKKSFTFALLLIAVVLTGIGVSGTYARYATVDQGTAIAQVAKWSVNITNENGNELSATNTVTFTPESSTHVVSGKIAPSLNSTANVVVNMTGTEVDVELKVEIDFDALSDADEEVAALVSDGRLTLTGKMGTTTIDTTGATPTVIPYSEVGEKTIELTLSWTEQDDDTANGDNEIDTAVGKNVTQMSLPIKVSAKQYIPAT